MAEQKCFIFRDQGLPALSWVLSFMKSVLFIYLMTPNTSMRELPLMGKYCPLVAITLGLLSDKCMSAVAHWRYNLFWLSWLSTSTCVGQLVMDGNVWKTVKLPGDCSSLYIQYEHLVQKAVVCCCRHRVAVLTMLTLGQGKTRRGALRIRRTQFEYLWNKMTRSECWKYAKSE